MGLQIFWFVVVAVFWTGFFVLEGFDFGVGALHALVGKSDTERRVAINTIGPYWDANEVWLIVAAAAMFAAFPPWYATMFSGFYLALVLVLVALILRGVAFEFRSKFTSPKWRQTWTWATTVASLLLPVLFGIALGDLLVGLPIDESGEYTGSFVDLLTPYGVWTGVTLLSLTLLHGATFLVLKTTDAIHERARRLAGRFAVVAVVAVIAFAVWTQIEADRGLFPGPIQLVGILAIVAAAWAVRDRNDGWAFAATAVAIGTTVASIFINLYPNVMVSSTDEGYSLTVADSASGTYALRVMTVVAAIFVPVVLAYQGWTYYVFRGRIRAPAAGTPTTAEPAGGTERRGHSTPPSSPMP